MKLCVDLNLNNYGPIDLGLIYPAKGLSGDGIEFGLWLSQFGIFVTTGFGLILFVHHS